MCRAESQFLSLLRDDESNDLISDAWDHLDALQRLEAVEIADAGELELMVGPEWAYDDEDALLVMS